MPKRLTGDTEPGQGSSTYARAGHLAMPAADSTGDDRRHAPPNKRRCSSAQWSVVQRRSSGAPAGARWIHGARWRGEDASGTWAVRSGVLPLWPSVRVNSTRRCSV